MYPGETLAISVVAVGQRYGTVPAAIRSYIQYERDELLGPEYLQRVKYCLHHPQVQCLFIV